MTVSRFSVITGPVIEGLLMEDLRGCVEVVREAYLAHSRGTSVTPHSLLLRPGHVANARFFGLASHMPAPWNVSGMKWIGSFPDNIRSGIPRASAVVILNDDATGYPFACLEGSIVSAARTAAFATLAAQTLLPTARRARVLGIVGNGLIARFIYRFLLGTGWSIDEVRLHDLDASRARRFAESVCDRSRHKSVRVTEDLLSTADGSDLLLFTTVSPQPYVHDPAVLAGNPLVLHVSLRDLAPELLLSARNIVDDVDHVLQAQTSVHLAEQRSGSRAFIAGTLADVISGALVAAEAGRPTVFSPFGLGSLDVAVAKWLYDRACATGQVTSIDRFFPDAPS